MYVLSHILSLDSHVVLVSQDPSIIRVSVGDPETGFVEFLTSIASCWFFECLQIKL